MNNHCVIIKLYHKIIHCFLGNYYMGLIVQKGVIDMKAIEF